MKPRALGLIWMIGILAGAPAALGASSPADEENDPELIEALRLYSNEQSSIDVPSDPTRIRVTVRDLHQRSMTGFRLRDAETVETDQIDVEILPPPGFRFQTNSQTPKRVSVEDGALKVSLLAKMPGPFWVSLYDLNDRRTLAQIHLSVRPDRYQFEKTDNCFFYDTRFETLAGESIPDLIRVDCRETDAGVWILLFHGNEHEIVPIETSVKSERDNRVVQYFIPKYLLRTDARTEVGTFKLSDYQRGRAVSYYRLTLRHGEATDPGAELAEQQDPHRFRLSAALGIASSRYSDPRISAFSMVALSAKLQLSRPFGAITAQNPFPRWDLQGAGYVTVAPLSKNKAQSVRFYGLNARLGYLFTPSDSEWRAGIYVGAYLTSMWVSDRSFGYQNVWGPQLFPTLKRVFRKGGSIGGYAKLSPISSNFNLLDLKNREIAFGLAYAFPSRDGVDRWSLAFDFASLQLYFGPLKVSSSSASLGLSYAL